MKYSKLFGRSVKEAEKDMTMASHKLLFQAGFIRESTAGRYFYLPLGQRVHEKIAKIVDEEMQSAGAQKMFAPVLHPIELWKETNRNKSGGYELMTVKDRRGAEFALGGTAEEMFSDVVRKFQISYKDLPFNIYQMGYKFRDELRARGGLLRVREFVMKDGYSFHTDDEDFIKEYKNMWKAYSIIFDRVGLKTDVVQADNGYFGGEYCHEFVVESEVGESTYFISEDGTYIAHEDVAKFKRDEINPDDEIMQYEIFEQPDWVRTMEENMEYYKLPKSRFLKNVVYKNRETGEIVIATIRGDLEVNKNKLEHSIDAVGLLDDATDEDLTSIGTKSGYVHSWGYTDSRVKFVGDISLKTVKNFIGGQKEEKTDSRNVNYGRDFEHPITADIAIAKDGFLTEDGAQKLIEKRGVEVGNIFHLGTHYSTKMKGVVFMDVDGKEKNMTMGCYGIGIGRTLATIVEKYHDDKGIIWPEAIAPFKVHLVTLARSQEDESFKKSQEIYNELSKKGIEVLWDDRLEVMPGEKFADADLIGNPYRVVVSERSIKNGQTNGWQDGVEIKKRSESESKVFSVEEMFKEIER